MQGGQLAADPAAAPVSDAAERSYVAEQRNEQLRRILLPLLGGATLLLVWWALIEIFQVKPFIAPAPQVGTTGMRRKRLHSPPDRNVIPLAVSAFRTKHQPLRCFSVRSLRRRGDLDPDQLLEAEIMPPVYPLPPLLAPPHHCKLCARGLSPG